MKENAAPFSSPTPVPRRSVPKSQEQPATAGPSPAPVSPTPVSSTNADEDGGNKESEGVWFVIIYFRHRVIHIMVVLVPL